MADNIVITQAYFANNKAAIDALNEFFAAAFKVKNFPFLDEESSIDKVLEKIISRLDAVDPTWLEDEEKLNGIIEMINEETAKLDPVEGIYQSIVDSNNTTLINAVDGYIGFKMLQMIADHFQDFGKLINGIYTFELFTKPQDLSNSQKYPISISKKEYILTMIMFRASSVMTVLRYLKNLHLILKVRDLRPVRILLVLKYLLMMQYKKQQR